MSYTSGDWTARQRYLLSSKLCFPQEDSNALLEFTNGLRSYASGDISGSDFSGSDFSGSDFSNPINSMPFFPIYSGTPASMAFGSASYLDLSSESMTLCTSMLTTDISGKLAIWCTLDAKETPFTIELIFNGAVVAQSSASPYIFFGTAEVMPSATYTAILQCTTTGILKIRSASIMMVGGLT